MRLFIAIRFSDEILDFLEAAQDEMKRAGIRGRYAPRENLHLTLAFIGEYDDFEAVREAMSKAVSGSFELRISGTGSFGSILWAGFEKSEKLVKLVKGLRHFLAESSVPFDRKRFSPHITLVRDAGVPRDLEFGRDFMKGSGPVTVDRISLMRSDRGKKGMVYTEIASAELDA